MKCALESPHGSLRHCPFYGCAQTKRDITATSATRLLSSRQLQPQRMTGPNTLGPAAQGRPRAGRAEAAATVAKSDRAGSRRTSVPCTRIRCPSRISRAKCCTPTTAGTPWSHAITAPRSSDPTSDARPLIATNGCVDLGRRLVQCQLDMSGRSRISALFASVKASGTHISSRGGTWRSAGRLLGARGETPGRGSRAVRDLHRCGPGPVIVEPRCTAPRRARRGTIETVSYSITANIRGLRRW